MTDSPGRRRNNPSDQTAERTSDPVPVGDDVIERDDTRPDLLGTQDGHGIDSTSPVARATSRPPHRR